MARCHRVAKALRRSHCGVRGRAAIAAKGAQTKRARVANAGHGGEAATVRVYFPYPVIVRVRDVEIAGFVHGHR
jgi:hypothetical protein